MKTYVIHLIRHGLTEANRKGAYIGVTDLPLLPESKAELARMKREGGYPQVSAVYSSPLLRCKQTAEVLYPNQEVIEIPEMAEYNFGDFEGKTGEELDSRPDYIAWASGKMAPPNGETNEDFVKRICLGLNNIVRSMMEKGIYSSSVIMHGGAIMMLLAAAGLPQRKSVDWMCSAGEGFTIRVTPSLYQRTGAVEVCGIVPQTGNDYDE